MSAEKERVTLSKSALLLSPCLTWAHPKSRWYQDEYTDTTDRDIGIQFHEMVDKYLKGKAECPTKT